ncbi:uncharacterized protein LOC111716589, partial [Eurytemora carolleeae]|uniref:uncharacterized protein LOC111716589 n=1 Tax=Eurytemora carolleeae TaxID=1294199 RepID=UPI000C78F4F8
MRGPRQNVGPIGLAVLMFIGYKKQTNRAMPVHPTVKNSQNQGNFDKYRDIRHNSKYCNQEVKQFEFSGGLTTVGPGSSSGTRMILQDSSNDGEAQSVPTTWNSFYEESNMNPEEMDCNGYYSTRRYGMV